jgi:hypothetical protein
MCAATGGAEGVVCGNAAGMIARGALGAAPPLTAAASSQ